MRTVLKLLSLSFIIAILSLQQASPEMSRPHNKKMFRVLSIDGGGVRGIIPARILAEIEKRTNKPIAELFDFIVGNSTGGLIALGLTTPNVNNKPKYTAKNLLDLYLESSKDIFKSSFLRNIITGNGLWGAKYSRENLDATAEKLFGDTLLSQTIKPVLVLSYSLTEGGPRLWSTDFVISNPKKDAYLKDLAVATTAAPTYFSPKELRNKGSEVLLEADGGIYANDPSTAAIATIYSNNPKMRMDDILLISIGTGKITLGSSAIKLKNAGVIGWVMEANLIDVMMSSTNNLCEWESTVFYSALTKRIQVNIPKNLGQMDNATKHNLKGLLRRTEEYIRDNDKTIQGVCDMLLSNSKAV
jgi:patatin-like phospholipase/acyl hydrolase